ncbi:MAG: hypothetical protein AB8E82_20290 [Aureispira sp.]
MKQYTFDLDKIVEFLNEFKDDLHKLYTWNAKIDRLVELQVLTDLEFRVLSKKVAFDREIILKQKINLKLREFYKSDKKQFDNLCLWIIKDWGGILTTKDSNTIELINEFLKSDNPSYKRIASSSKVGAYMYPDKYVIYDSRVAYSLNWILLSKNAGTFFFPIPSGRNSKMMAFDMNVLIRLKNIDHYSPRDVREIDKKQYVSQKDKSQYIPKNEAYLELNKLIKEISAKLWDDENAKKMLYYTEMLLFSIADREIYMDITKKLTLGIK